MKGERQEGEPGINWCWFFPGLRAVRTLTTLLPWGLLSHFCSRGKIGFLAGCRLSPWLWNVFRWQIPCSEARGRPEQVVAATPRRGHSSSLAGSPGMEQGKAPPEAGEWGHPAPLAEFISHFSSILHLSPQTHLPQKVDEWGIQFFPTQFYILTFSGTKGRYNPNPSAVLILNCYSWLF